MEAPEILQDIVFLILYGVVMGLSIAAALYLLLRRSNAIVPEVTPPLRLRLWATAIMLENVVSHVFWLWYFCHPTTSVYVLVCTQDILLLIPAVAGFLLSMLQDRHRPVWPVIVALAQGPLRRSGTQGSLAELSDTDCVCVVVNYLPFHF